MCDISTQIMIGVLSTVLATVLLSGAGYWVFAVFRTRELRAVIYEIPGLMASILKPAGLDRYAVEVDALNSLVHFLEEEVSRIDHGFMRPNLKTRLELKKLRDQVISWKGEFTESRETPSYILGLREGMQTRLGQKTESDKLAKSLEGFAKKLSARDFFPD